MVNQTPAPVTYWDTWLSNGANTLVCLGNNTNCPTRRRYGFPARTWTLLWQFRRRPQPGHTWDAILPSRRRCRHQRLQLLLGRFGDLPGAESLTDLVETTRFSSDDAGLESLTGQSALPIKVGRKFPQISAATTKTRVVFRNRSRSCLLFAGRPSTRKYRREYGTAIAIVNRPSRSQFRNGKQP